MLLCTSSIANNIAVSNVSLEGQNLTEHYCYIEFDLSWENSWRNSTVPNNWDAAWIIVKYNVALTEWNQASLHGSGHIAASGSTIDAPADSVGVFIYRSANGSGTASWTDLRVRWDYGEDGVSDDALVQVAITAIEMVYVPQESFYLGDGSSDRTFYDYPTTTNPYEVTSAPILVDNTSGNLWATGGIGLGIDGTTIPSSFPTGYEAFYCMKYELSQEQYVEFLNFLTRPQQNNRVKTDISGSSLPEPTWVMSDTDIMQFRNSITCTQNNGTTDPISFYQNYQIGPADGQNIACNFVTYMDMAAYADWSGLRPMTGMEYEKACRGPNTPVNDELAWGNTLVSTTTYTIGYAGADNEYITNPSISYGNIMYSSTSGNFDGPGRCGIIAASANSPTRMETGASYYGIMEMSGNLHEFTVAPFCVAGLSYTALHGDGVLTTDGYANTDYWPGINGNDLVNYANQAYSTEGVTSAAGIAKRSGSWASSIASQSVSFRLYAVEFTIEDTIHFSAAGIRLVRTAP